MSAAYQPRGFTLLELLMAVGLTSILMIALFSAMSIYFDLQMDSHEEITRQQVARALLRQMTRDIQSTVFVKKRVTDDTEGTATSSTSGSASSGTAGGTSGSSGNSGGSTGSATAGGSTSASGSSVSTGTASGGTRSSSSTLDGNSYGQSSVDPETVLTTYTNGLVGSKTDLQLFVSRPDRNLSYVPAQELVTASERSSDLLLIRYLMADTGGGGLGSAIADRESPGSDSGPVGLARMEGDLYGLSTAMMTTEEIPQVTASKLLSREVVRAEFRYFDGLNWQEEWDSNALNEMPRAVEITLTLRDTVGLSSVSSDDEPDPYALPETIHRMVVPIPVAEPFVTESAL